MRSLLALATVLIAAVLAIGILRHHSTGRAPGAVFASGGAIDQIDLGGRRHELIPARAGARSAQGIAVLRDGSLVLADGQRLTHVDAHGHPLRDLGRGFLPAVSPDGAQLAFVLGRPGRDEVQVWLMNLDGSHRRRLTHGAPDLFPAWSPDGSTILFTRFARGASTAKQARSWLETVPAAGGTPRRITSSGYDRDGRYSPDGRWIAFGSGRDRVAQVCGEDECAYATQLYAMHPDGSDEHRITQDRASDVFPVFASRTTIVYSRMQHATYRSELYRVEVDGSCGARLTRDALDDVLATTAPGSGADVSGCPSPTPPRALPQGPDFDVGNSKLTPASARSWRGLPLFWIGQRAGPFVLTNISTSSSRLPGRAPSMTAYLIYPCVTGDDCTRQLQLIETPVCARPTFPATGGGAIGSTRGVPRVRYPSQDDLFVGRTVITIYGDRDARELAERELRSLNALAGHVAAGDRLPAPPRGILAGLPCQPPAIIKVPPPP